MFAARGIAVSLSVFVLVYLVGSLAVCLCWRAVWLYGQQHSARRAADWLFLLRMFPLLSAAVITAVFTVPSFILLEPRAIEEPVGEIPVDLSICAVALGIFALMNAVVSIGRASRVISMWTGAAEPLACGDSIPILRIPPGITGGGVPAMTAAGIFRPRVLISGKAESMLTAGELRTALHHEFAHVCRRDNLKKLLLRLVAFPGMAALEHAWLESAEMAADDAAVLNAGDALDLAAALIKLSQLKPAAPVDLTASLVNSSGVEKSGALMRARVMRLISWGDEHHKSRGRFSLWYGVAAALIAIAAFAATYSRLLVQVHAATEWLVK